MSWTALPLGEVVELRRGFDLPKQSRVEGPYPIFSSSGCSGRHIQPAVDGPCVITGRYGTIGEVFFSEGPCWPLNTSLYATDFKGNSPRFVYYLLKQFPWSEFSTASAVPGINRNHINGHRVSIPDLATQETIVEILGALDDKIALNTHMNGCLEELLLTRYRNDFTGKAAESWRIGYISDIGEVVGGATPSKKRPDFYCDDGIGWITPKDLSGSKNKFISHGKTDITEEGFSSCSARLLPAGTVLFSSRAPVGYTAIASSTLATNQGFKSIVPKAGIGTAFVYCFLKENAERIEAAGSGTTFTEVSGKVMKSIELKLPSADACAEFSAFAEPVLNEQLTLERESARLAALRDALLPKLMSGEIDVSEVDVGGTLANSHACGC